MRQKSDLRSAQQRTVTALYEGVWLGPGATNGWVELWSGGVGICPLADGTKVTVQFRDGIFLYGTIGDTRTYRVPGRGLEYGLREDFWRFHDQPNDIIAYQIDRTPRGERR